MGERRKSLESLVNQTEKDLMDYLKNANLSPEKNEEIKEKMAQIKMLVKLRSEIEKDFS